MYASHLQQGQTILARVTVRETTPGVFEVLATGIDVMPSRCVDESDDDDVECEDGLTPEGLPCADDDDGEAVDEDNVEEECEDGLTPEGLPCADDDDEDGDEGEEEECAELESEAFEMIAAPVDGAVDSGVVLQLMGINVEMPPAAGIQAPGNYRFVGAYNADQSLFKATDLVTTRSATFRLMTKIQSIDTLPDGTLDFSMFDLHVLVDPGLPVRKVTTFSQEIDQDLDGDLVQCEQEGEHEGENEGCP
jgi:hypothetical protein